MTIGWYIHHHGSGHLRRFEAIRPQLDHVVALSSLSRPPAVDPADWIGLALDAPADVGPVAATAGGRLHWAPPHHPGLRARMARLAGWLRDSGATLLVCDVSAEVAILARTMGVPVAWIAGRGDRRDAPHQLAYGLSTVLAPWTAELATPDSGLPADTRFCGMLSRFDGRVARERPGDRRVVVVLGAGGHAVSAQDIATAATATPRWRWSVAGLGRPAVGPVRDLGQPEDVWAVLQDADVVVASAGANLVAEVAAARRPLVCIPQTRPFDEQTEQAASLRRAGLAVTVDRWPAGDAWPALLARAAASDPADWSRAHDGHGATRIAAAIRRLGEPACASA